MAVRRHPANAKQHVKWRCSIETVIICILLSLLFVALGPVKRHGQASSDAAHPLVHPARAKTMLELGIGAKMLDVEDCAHAGQQLVGRVRVVPYDTSGCSAVPTDDVPTCTPRVCGDKEEGEMGEMAVTHILVATQDDGCTENCVWEIHGLAYVHPAAQYVLCIPMHV